MIPSEALHPSGFNQLLIHLQGHQKLCNLSCDETADLFNLVKKIQKLVEQFRGVSSSTIALQVYNILQLPNYKKVLCLLSY